MIYVLLFVTARTCTSDLELLWFVISVFLVLFVSVMTFCLRINVKNSIFLSTGRTVNFCLPSIRHSVSSHDHTYLLPPCNQLYSKIAVQARASSVMCLWHPLPHLLSLGNFYVPSFLPFTSLVKHLSHSPSFTTPLEFG